MITIVTILLVAAYAVVAAKSIQKERKWRKRWEENLR